jgi:hypothetical protein
MKKAFFLLMIFVMSTVFFGSILTNTDSPFELKLSYENGFIKIFEHTLSFGSLEAGNTVFDYVEQGGQEILFPFERLSAEIIINKRHNLTFLYQPLTIETKVPLKENIKIANVEFNKEGENDALYLKYGFPFWRFSYLYNFIHNEKLEFGLGVSLQLRNASIIFEKNDGSSITVGQNLGPVPILKIRGKYTLDNNLYFAADCDGFYASSAWINGADFDFEGSVFDLSFRVGGNMTEYLESFLSIRYFGGSAVGVSQYETARWSESAIEEANITSNIIKSMIISLGFIIK